jgi:uncharacterized protein
MKTEYIIGIIVLGLILVGAYMLDVSSPVVSAQGTSTMRVQPDNAVVYVSIETRNKTAQSAQEAHALIRDAVVSSLARMGIAEKDIQLTGYSIYQEYDWSNGRQTPKGFVASQQIVVRTQHFDELGRIVDRVVENGGLVSSVYFEISPQKQNEYKSQALSNASEDAKDKATATAAGLGKKLGRLVSVQTQDFYYPGPMLYYDKAMESEASGASVRETLANTTPQDIDVNANIVVQYKLRRF